MTEKTKLTEAQIQLFNKFINTKDILDISIETGLSHTTIYNIANGKYSMNVKTEKVLPILNITAYKKIMLMKNYIEVVLVDLQELDEIKEFLNNNIPKI